MACLSQSKRKADAAEFQVVLRWRQSGRDAGTARRAAAGSSIRAAAFCRALVSGIPLNTCENQLSQPNAVAHGGEHARCWFDFFASQTHCGDQGGCDEQGVLGSIIAHGAQRRRIGGESQSAGENPTVSAPCCRNFADARLTHKVTLR